LNDLQIKIFELCGRRFNLNSPRQLGEVLYDDLGLATGKKRSGGAFSTDSEELERLSGEHPVIPMIIEHRQIAKLRSTYVEGLKKVCDPSDGRVHTTFNQILTATGRLSSSDPNLQNIPIRMEAGQKIRRAFIAAPEHILIDADYSQVELRLLAHLSGDQAMIEAFVRAEDIHTNTACRIFNLPPEKITPDMRSIAKTMNFSIVYGISDFGLARDLGISVRQAHHYIAEYEEQYPEIRRYLTSLVDKAYQTGYVETVTGRRRYMPELKSANRNLRQFGERAAMNTPVQGSAADLIKIAMVLTAAGLKAAGLQAGLILQVHDELIIESPLAEADQAAAILRESMENAMHLQVPLLAEVHRGFSWAECK
ncbi:MAG TPA: DNA polymerase I, partial [Clostridiales bacterium]|nr:DNA polymerase I [Clostridiales bacterium]